MAIRIHFEHELDIYLSIGDKDITRIMYIDMSPEILIVWNLSIIPNTFVIHFPAFVSKFDKFVCVELSFFIV